MAKQKVFLHVGARGGVGDFLDSAVLTHRDALADSGVHCPVENADQSLRAVLDIRRTHRQHGLKRREVEGAWAHICRRILKAKHKRPAVISQPLFADADRDQIDLLVDQLPGCAVHVVLVVGVDTAPEAAHDLVLRWSRAVKKPGRLHVIEADDTTDRVQVWQRFADLVGLEPEVVPERALAA